MEVHRRLRGNAVCVDRDRHGLLRVGHDVPQREQRRVVRRNIGACARLAGDNAADVRDGRAACIQIAHRHVDRGRRGRFIGERHRRLRGNALRVERDRHGSVARARVAGRNVAVIGDHGHHAALDAPLRVGRERDIVLVFILIAHRDVRLVRLAAMEVHRRLRRVRIRVHRDSHGLLRVGHDVPQREQRSVVRRDIGVRARLAGDNAADVRDGRVACVQITHRHVDRGRHGRRGLVEEGHGRRGQRALRVERDGHGSVARAGIARRNVAVIGDHVHRAALDKELHVRVYGDALLLLVLIEHGHRARVRIAVQEVHGAGRGDAGGVHRHVHARGACADQPGHFAVVRRNGVCQPLGAFHLRGVIGDALRVEVAHRDHDLLGRDHGF